jgi:hypothetical protein
MFWYKVKAKMMNNDESGLNELFQSYRAACPEVEASAVFMPRLWQKIELRHGFWPIFQGLARTAMAGCAALALLLLALNFAGPQQMTNLAPSYTDALVADHSAEKTYYAESVIRQPVPVPDDVSPADY